MWCSKVVIERMQLSLLPWGERTELSQLATRQHAGYDWVVGADVVYAPAFVEPLMMTVSRLLARNAQVDHQLC